ncbi:MAG: YebC/PmpR family DNA-binding transcriptional regulator [Clostridiaceae bacterium]|nr:YebC/PmpR family DNA-binding transcriptional regulator [Clostridiaceae bacterium]
MAGHSKWANIKHRKERSDAKKGKLFSKIGRELLVAAKQGGPDPEANSKLKDVIAKARAANMPNDNIMRIIKKAAGDLDSENYEEITYEGYGPGGVAVIVEVMTDNRNRTAGEIRHYFDRFGGNLGQTGCVSFLFEKKGLILIEKTGSIDEDTLMMDAVNAGAEDFDAQDEYFEILTDPADFSAVREDLEKKGYSFISAGVEMIPGTTIKLVEPEHIEKMSKLIDSLEDMDDVQNVYHNWEQE